MPRYSYKGRDRSGKAVNGQQVAADEQAVAEQLIRQGVIPIQITEVAEKAKSLELPAWLTRRQVTLDDLLLFCRQMYSLTRAGISVIRAVNNLKDSITNRALAEALTDIADELQRGLSLAVAMRAHPRVFPSLFVSIVHVGENTGHLDESFQQLSDYYELEMETRKRIKTATRYPSFVVTAIAIAIVVLNIFVIPQFVGLFERFGADLPLPTRILMATSSFFVNDWWILLLIVAGITLGVRQFLSTENGRQSWDRYKLRLPIIGSILERALLGRFARSFGMMVRSGIPLHQALGLVADAVGNAYMSKRLRGMREGIERGESLLRTAAASGLFTPLVLQMIEVGEETGQVDVQMVEVAGYYEREVDYDLKSLTAKIEPILIGIVAVMVLILALGIFLPMWNMMNVMKGGG
ncbi:type II secretion system F family protein [Dongshaea marina]|uniref:type II secretion system F family protein n=1 Tax=Dongshaea marina TaxID=2047966 RepID=UPI000D3ED8E2|nr:type II secretion system F family protein [Dongshaea marina]